jgi:hypothetical protein
MQQLATALGHLAPSLFATADIQHAEETQKQLSEGEQAILADKRLQNRKALREAVANGTIPAARNPWFMQGMRQQVYRIEGERFDQGLRTAYAQSGSRNQDDISDFVGGYTQEYLKNLGGDSNDPEMARIFTPMVERSQANLLSAHRTERDQAIQATVEQNTDTEIGLILDNMDESGGSPEFYAKTIHGMVNDQYQNGLDGTRSNQIMAAAIARKAGEKLDTSYLDLMDKIPAGPDGKSTLAQIGFVKDLRRKTEESIYHQLEEQTRVNAKLAKDQKDAAKTKGLSDGFNAIIQNPLADIRPILKDLAEADPEAAEKLYGWRQSHINDANKDVIEDPDKVVSLTGKVFAGNGDLGEVLDAQRHGSISLSTATKLAENIDRSKEFRSTLRDPTIQELHKNLGMVIKGSDTDFKNTDAINAGRAQNAFLEGMTNFKRDNPKASDLDIIKHGRALQKELIDTYANGAAIDAGNAIEITSKNVLIADPSSVDWERKAIFKPDEIRKAVEEYNATRGTSGVLVSAANHVGVPVADFYKAQVRLSSTPKPKPNK